MKRGCRQDKEMKNGKIKQENIKELKKNEI